MPGTNIAAYCGMEKNNQLGKGRTLHQLLEKGFTLNLATSLRMYGAYSLGGGPNTSRPASNHDFHLDGTAPSTSSAWAVLTLPPRWRRYRPARAWRWTI